MFDFKIVLLIFLPVVYIEGLEIDAVPLEAPTVKPTIITREEWGARKSVHDATPREGPAPYVIVHHTNRHSCTSLTQCIAEMKVSQNEDIDIRHWNDTSFNFYVGEDGNVYEGRGWDAVGPQTKLINRNSIGICLIGNFLKHPPQPSAIEATKNLISYGVSLRKINPGYISLTDNHFKF